MAKPSIGILGMGSVGQALGAGFARHPLERDRDLLLAGPERLRGKVVAVPPPGRGRRHPAAVDGSYLRPPPHLLGYLALSGSSGWGWYMAAAASPVLLEVDALIRRYGLVPSEDVRSLLARAAEQRMLERGEPFAVAVQRAVALLALSARPA